jgi:hypothetical protein
MSWNGSPFDDPALLRAGLIGLTSLWMATAVIIVPTALARCGPGHAALAGAAVVLGAVALAVVATLSVNAGVLG